MLCPSLRPQTERQTKAGWRHPRQVHIGWPQEAPRRGPLSQVHLRPILGTVPTYQQLLHGRYHRKAVCVYVFVCFYLFVLIYLLSLLL